MARTPCLPSEVWLSIFDWATFVPFALDTHPPDPFAYLRTPAHKDIQEAIRESLCTKRRLVLVCWEWRALATRFLYQAIIIFESRILPALLRAICAKPMDVRASDLQGPTGNKGHWVMRLDIELDLDDTLPRDGFSRLLSSMPNLQILVADVLWYEQFNHVRPLFEALAAKLAPSLRVLHVSSVDGMYLYDFRVLPIPEAINGRPFRVLTIPLESWMENVGETMLDLPNIEYLDIPSRWTETLLAACDVPSSLVFLSLADKWAPAKRLAEGQLSIARNGIDTLWINDYIPARYWTTGSIELPMHRVAVAFPNLHCLIVHVRSASFAQYLPPVKKLGLRVIFDDTSEDQWETLCATIERLIAITPTVKVVRLFQRLSHDDFELQYDGVVNVVRQTSSKLLSMYKVRLEDLDGRLFHSLEITQDQ